MSRPASWPGRPGRPLRWRRATVRRANLSRATVLRVTVLRLRRRPIPVRSRPLG
ncbi:hypothetical protein [Nonomuraea lactucae]|uniref:hypothetical protein n=1 Tax=Nonomuraea lactucae TaxID=2249762 RepID=UPI0013B3A2D3|nr:hypothetical protein [Nonomuraea lactucae]